MIRDAHDAEMEGKTVGRVIILKGLERSVPVLLYKGRKIEQAMQLISDHYQRLVDAQVDSLWREVYRFHRDFIISEIQKGFEELG